MWYPTKNSENKTDDSAPVYKMRNLNKVNKGSIFRNELGTKLGPGDHTDKGDPFSLIANP